MLQILVALTVFLAATVGTGRDVRAEATEGERSSGPSARTAIR